MTAVAAIARMVMMSTVKVSASRKMRRDFKMAQR